MCRSPQGRKCYKNHFDYKVREKKRFWGERRKLVRHLSMCFRLIKKFHFHCRLRFHVPHTAKKTIRCRKLGLYSLVTQRPQFLEGGSHDIRYKNLLTLLSIMSSPIVQLLAFITVISDWNRINSLEKKGFCRQISPFSNLFRSVRTSLLPFMFESACTFAFALKSNWLPTCKL